MIIREAIATTSAPARDLMLRSPPNWTAVIFFACLSGLHCAIAFPAFYYGRWEGYLSLIFAIVFATAAIVSFFARYDMTIFPSRRCIRVRQRIAFVRFQRLIAFDDVHAVRLTMNGSRESRIEILCDNEDLDCPPTTIPRQEALFLAILLGVQLIKVCDDTPTREDRSI
jgi:hypothetical protein